MAKVQSDRQEGLQAEGTGQELDPLPGPGESVLGQWAGSQVPWWVISTALHALAIILMGLITMAVNDAQAGGTDPIVMVDVFRPATTPVLERPRIDSRHVLDSKHDTPPTDPNSDLASDIVVPREILEQAELSDHFETPNPEMEDRQQAFGNQKAHMFHSVHGDDDAAGGGGQGGLSLDEMIGVGAGNSPGTGGGWGGGDGTGKGVDVGSGHGSYGGRFGGRRLLVQRHGGSRQTEDRVEASLRWLAAHQEADGHWDTVKYSSGQKTDTACTAFAVLAFMGAGHTEKFGPYQERVRRAIGWLKSKQQANGLVFDASDAGGHRGVGYPHAIAGMALAEAAGMARIPDTIAAAQKAIDYSSGIHQQGEGSEKGGWRYAAKTVPDLSVTGWYIMQLKSAKVAGLRVDPASFEGAVRFLDAVETKGAAGESYGGHKYSYQPGKAPGHRVTAIGCLGRQFLGWKREELQGGVEWFVQQGGVPEWGANGGSVDLYYWYYATYCTFQQGADIWKRWNEAMKTALVENQRKGGDEDGSWDPVGAYSGDWGRVGQTALACMCLQVYYRHLRMYRD